MQGLSPVLPGCRTSVPDLTEGLARLWHSAGTFLSTPHMEQERRRHWSFVISNAGAWSWRVLNPDCSAVVSPTTYKTLKDCVADARTHGYVLPPEDEDRRQERRAPPSVMVSQEVQCPRCRHSWDLPRKAFVSAGDRIECRYGCGHFTASSSCVTCCIEQADGLVEMPLP